MGGEKLGFVRGTSGLNSLPKGAGSDRTWFGRPLIKIFALLPYRMPEACKEEEEEKMVYSSALLSTAKELLTDRQKARITTWSVLGLSQDLGRQYCTARYGTRARFKSP